MEFLQAVAKNDVEKVRIMLQSSIDVNNSFMWNSKNTYSPVIPSDLKNKPELLNSLQTDQEYLCKPLNIAVIGGYANMVRLLLSAGADINHKDGRGRTAIVCAIYGLDLDASNINTSNLHLISQTNATHFDIMKNILLCHPNLYSATLDSPQYEIKGITPLCLASYLGKAEVIQLLLEDGRVNVDGTDSKNATALMYAARDGNVPIVKMLLSYHASPDITDSHGWSAIQYAERSPEIVQLCEQVLRIKRSELTVAANHCAVNYPINYSKLSHLLTTIPNYPSSLAHLHFDALKDIDYLDPSAAPLVHIVQSAFLQAIKIHDHLSLQTLLMRSPPLNNFHQGGPLLVNHHDAKTGLTAFHHAMRTKPLPSLDTITMLFQAGADMNAQTYYGRTALHHLARFGLDKDGITWGIQKSNPKEGKTTTSTPPSSPSSKTTETMMGVSNVPEHLAMCASLLIRFGSLVNIADPTGNTPLHFAAEFGGVPEVVEVLILEGNADLSLKNKKGLTPLDVCKSDELKKKMLQLEAERKTCYKTKSILSSLSGTIRPFDSASEYNRTSIVAYAPRQHANMSHFFQDKKMHMATQKQLLVSTIQRKEDDPSYEDYSDFDVILKAFFDYQTTFTDSIESSLAYITDSIMGTWKEDEEQQSLRYELREAHEMFDATDQLVEKVMMSFREELEQVEQVHQADWELSELQHDKIEKLFDVFERIDHRFCQLELAQYDLIAQVERLRKAATRKQQQFNLLDQEEQTIDSGDCVIHLLQSLLILQTVPIDKIICLRDDRNRLHQDMTVVVEQVMKQLEQEKDEKYENIKQSVKERWSIVQDMLTKNYSIEEDKALSPYSTKEPKQSKRNKRLNFSYDKHQSQSSLDQLELSFDILQSNLYEIQKDIEEVNGHLEKLLESKKEMYELCISLEKELDDNSKRPQDQVQSELNQVLKFTQQLFDKQIALDKEKAQLLKEYSTIEQQLDVTREALQKVRPPVLLQSLLERLDTDEVPRVQVEKDWKEDTNLVTEVVGDMHDSQNEDTDDSCASSITSSQDQSELSTLQLKQLGTQCASKLSTLCYLARLDASLYCLKVLAGHLISKSRQQLLQVQVALGQASNDLDETRNQMTQLYDDAAEVARQVFALKTELETIVRHRKEEVIKVWEVVDEVSEGVNVRYQSQQRQEHHQQQHQQQQEYKQKERTEEQDRHQWIIRELEQLQHVHSSLQDAIKDLKHEQVMISQNLRQLAAVFIEPQVDKLVGQDDTSLLSISDLLAELMNRVRDNELGLRSVSFCSTQAISTINPDSSVISTQTKLTGTGSHASKNVRQSLHRLSHISSNRLSVSTYNSNRSSSYTRSILDNRNSNKRLSAAFSIKNDKKRMSIISTTSLSSLSSYQQERIISRASNLSNILFKAQQKPE
ncbi:uncharacterized protein B0P05DRAFT_573039 [Gilbertella persicaria]|uniref:uncharacterized protein n=1 Tax=Gilbertella persicaria TaxID=101096 RepID=UPI00221FDC28|nr:uncharacterized protein B0P05DRAFT_573039 [Gilbertella persicaria]KAI8073501.1 hypothetical protein B0P05DRAFT_573039 [Gilbertella persicaria]